MSPTLRQPGVASTPGYVLQSFELATAQYTASRYPMALACFLYQYNGANLGVTQADPFLGNYPSALGLTITYPNGNTAALPPLGGTCAWCVNGTSRGGWADVDAAIASPGGSRIAGGISIADVVVPQARARPPSSLPPLPTLR